MIVVVLSLSRRGLKPRHIPGGGVPAGPGVLELPLGLRHRADAGAHHAHHLQAAAEHGQGCVHGSFRATASCLQHLRQRLPHGSIRVDGSRSNHLLLLRCSAQRAEAKAPECTQPRQHSQHRHDDGAEL